MIAALRHARRFPSPGDPTPRQIARRAAKIRQGWTPKERRRRTVTHQPRWTAPVIAVGALENRALVEAEIQAAGAFRR